MEEINVEAKQRYETLYSPPHYPTTKKYHVSKRNIPIYYLEDTHFSFSVFEIGYTKGRGNPVLFAVIFIILSPKTLTLRW